MSIEMQGNNIDSPDRLFYSVEGALNNMSLQKSDLRELIPELFYLPEMFMNINNINFGKTGAIKIDDCIVPNDNKEKTIEKFCIFINEMIYYLEKDEDKSSWLTKTEDISDWIQIIFGENQKYDTVYKGQYFRSDSYIDKLSEEFSKRIIDQIIIDSYEF